MQEAAREGTGAGEGAGEADSVAMQRMLGAAGERSQEFERREHSGQDEDGVPNGGTKRKASEGAVRYRALQCSTVRCTTALYGTAQMMPNHLLRSLKGLLIACSVFACLACSDIMAALAWRLSHAAVPGVHRPLQYCSGGSPLLATHPRLVGLRQHRRKVVESLPLVV